jgi:N-acyl-phosphatidylethanolamine-hydrolysing phospholipase D
VKHARLLLLPALLGACAAIAVTDPPPQGNRGPDGFQNNYPHPQIAGGFWKWRWQRLWQDRPDPPPGGWQLPATKADSAFLRANRSAPTLTWIGHATLLVQAGGVNILTDPHFSARASPLPFAGPTRQVAPALALAELPHIEAVVISHNHYDHLDRESVTALARQPGGPPQFFVPLGLATWFREAGIETVTELDWWQSRGVGGVALHFTPAQHWSRRGLTDRNATLWGSWVIEAPGFRFLFAGDTGYSLDFRDIGARFSGFDVAALPIGAYEPRWFMRPQHVDPQEALQIHHDLRARCSLAIHWGTFVLSDEALDEPPRALAAARAAAGVAEDRFRVVPFGQTVGADCRPL